MRKVKACLFVVLFLTAAVYFVFAFTPVGRIITFLSSQNPGPFKRIQFQTIVGQVRKTSLKTGEIHEFMLSNLSGMGTLTPLKPSTYIIRGKGAGHVWAQLSESGALKVVIETRDFGHFGEYGFAYSDLPLSLIPYPSDSEWFTIDEPGPLNMGRRDMKIDDHWWKTSNPD